MSYKALKRQLTTTLSLILVQHIGFAQASYSSADSVYVFNLINKAQHFFNNSMYDSAITNAEKAISYSRQKNFVHGEAWSMIKNADILIEKGDYAKAVAYPLLVERLGLKMKDSMVTAVSYLHQAQIKMYDNELDSAIHFFQKAFKTKLERVISPYSALAYNDLGYTYGQKAEHNRETENLIKALNYYERLGDDGGAAMALSNLASMYDGLGDKQKALEYEKKSIAKRQETDIEGLAIGYCNICQMYMQSGNLKEAEYYQQLCLKFSRQSRIESKVVLGLITSGLLASSKGDSRGSYEMEKKVIEILEKSHSNDQMLAKRYLAAAIGSGNLKEDSLITTGYFKKAMDLSHKLNLRDNLKLIYYYYTVFYKTRGDYYNAYDNYKKYIVYKDSLNSAETKLTIAELETKYQTEKKDNEISRLNNTQKITQLEIDKQKAVIEGNILQAQKKQNEIDLLAKTTELLDIKIKHQDEQLEKSLLIAKNNDQALKLAEQDKQLKERQLKQQRQLRNILVGAVLLLATLGIVVFNRYQLKKKLEQQEILLSVRNNIAKDLHDEIGSTLTSIKILSEVSQTNLQKDQHKTSLLLKKITEQSSQMQQGMSDIIWAIKPDNDKLENMLIRMREYIAQTLEPKGIATVFEIDEKVLQEVISMEQRRDFFLIFKEAINNVAKYAQCRKVMIRLMSANGNINLIITDDGIGFNIKQTGSSNGLKNMQERARAMNGNLNIQSTPGKGTLIDLKIPAT